MLKALVNMIKGGATCKSVNAFLTDYVEGRLEPKTARRFEDHIEVCPNCLRYLDQYRETVSMLHEIQPPPIPPELEARTCDFLHKALSEESGSSN
jgi:anti-sigma factor RsiW